MSDASQDPIVIVGMGGGGLAAAIKLIQQGHKVAIFENRDHFTRPQRISIKGESEAFINSLIDSNDPLDEEYKNRKISEVDSSTRVRSVQKFLERKLLALQKEFPERVSIHHGQQVKITAIDPENQIISFEENKEKKTSRFSHFIEADGARHLMADLLNATAQVNGKQPYFKFELQEVQHRHPPCGVIQLKLNLPEMGLNEKDIKKLFQLISGEINWANEDNEYLIEHGWDKPYYPMQYFFSDANKATLNLATEVPEEILMLYKNKETRKEFRAEFLEWAQFFFETKIQKLLDDEELIRETLQDDEGNVDEEKLDQIIGMLNVLGPGHLAIQPKEQKGDKPQEVTEQLRDMNATAFPLDYMGADKPTTKLGKGGVYALIGDSFQSPWFFGGHGMNDAITGGIQFAECLNAKGNFALDKFNAGMNQRRKREIAMISDPAKQSNLKLGLVQAEFSAFKGAAQALFDKLSTKNVLEAHEEEKIKKLLLKIDCEIQSLAKLGELVTLEKNVQKLSKMLLKHQAMFHRPKTLTASFQKSKKAKYLDNFAYVEKFSRNFDEQVHIILETNFPQKPKVVPEPKRAKMQN